MHRQTTGLGIYTFPSRPPTCRHGASRYLSASDLDRIHPSRCISHEAFHFHLQQTASPTEQTTSSRRTSSSLSSRTLAVATDRTPCQVRWSKLVGEAHKPPSRVCGRDIYDGPVLRGQTDHTADRATDTQLHYDLKTAGSRTWRVSLLSRRMFRGLLRLTAHTLSDLIHHTTYT